jgi:excisionase family DNA binding protein
MSRSAVHLFTTAGVGIVLVLDDAAKVALLRNSLASTAVRLGRDRCPTWVRELVDDLPTHPTPSAATTFDNADGSPHTLLMTYTEAADRLGLSKSTVGRMVARGQLTTVGRRVTLASVLAVGSGRGQRPPRGTGGTQQ